MSLPFWSAKRNWRSAIAELDPVTAPSPLTLHAVQLLLAHGLRTDAESACREFLQQFPEHIVALQTIAGLLRREGREQEAREFLVRSARLEALRLDLPRDKGAAVEQFFVAAEQGTSPPTESPAAYITDLYDSTADRFDSSLLEHLQYRAPALLFEKVSEVLGPAVRDLDVLDLGCGTGLAGVAFHPVARRLHGVDLSPRMLELAAAKEVYESLTVGEIVAYLKGTDCRYDLILAADVFVYLGDLHPVFAAARRTLSPSGLFAFTVEAGDQEGYQLRPTRRYAHHRDYLVQAADAVGFTIRSLDQTWTRLQSSQPVHSYLCVFSILDEDGRRSE